MLKECTCCQHINLLHFFFFKESRSLKNYFKCLCSLTSIPWGQSLSAGPVLFKKAAQDSLMQEGRAGPGTRHRQRGWSPVLREGKWSLRDSARSLCHSPAPPHQAPPTPPLRHAPKCPAASVLRSRCCSTCTRSAQQPCCSLFSRSVMSASLQPYGL